MMSSTSVAIDELRRSSVAHDLFMTSAVSLRVPDADLVVLKPPGVSRDALTSDSVVVMDLSGGVLDGVLAPSVGGDEHAYVYRKVPAVGGVVNTCSTLSLVAAARGEPFPLLPAIRDEFGDHLPVVSHSGPRAVLIRGYGLFTVGPTVGDALSAAAVLEHAIRTVHIARNLGTAEPLDPHDTAWLRH